MKKYASALAPVVSVAHGDLQCVTDDHKTNSGVVTEDIDDGLNLVIFSILGVIGLLIFVGTLIELSSKLKPSIPSILEPNTSALSIPVQLLKCFSLFSNGSSLLSTRSTGSGHLGSINGMKYVKQYSESLASF